MISTNAISRESQKVLLSSLFSARREKYLMLVDIIDTKSPAEELIQLRWLQESLALQAAILDTPLDLYGDEKA